MQFLGSRLVWCSIARLRDSVGTLFIVVRELWLALIPGRAYRPRSKSVGRVLRCCPGKLRYGYSQIGSIGRTVGPGAAADLGGIWTRSGWSSGIRFMMWSEIMSELQAWRAGACIASRCTKKLCLAIGAPAIPCDTCSPIGQQIPAAIAYGPRGSSVASRVGCARLIASDLGAFAVQTGWLCAAGACGSSPRRNEQPTSGKKDTCPSEPAPFPPDRPLWSARW